MTVKAKVERVISFSGRLGSGCVYYLVDLYLVDLTWFINLSQHDYLDYTV